MTYVAAYIWCFCAQFSCDHDLLTFTMSYILSFISNAHRPTNFEHPTITFSWVMGDSHYHHMEGYCAWPCHVTY